MKTLLILRHAKAEEMAPDGLDASRSLSERGRKDAARMGKAIRKLDLIPERILCSPAVRTTQTVDVVLEKWKEKPDLVLDETIYNAAVRALVYLLQAQPSVDRILLVGHNPGLEELVSRLTSGSQAAIRLPTCCLARIDFEMEQWDDVVDVPGQLTLLLSADSLKEL